MGTGATRVMVLVTREVSLLQRQHLESPGCNGQLDAYPRLELAQESSRLSSGQDGEVVVCHVDSRMALSTAGAPEEDQVLGDGRVQDDHGAGGATGHVEHETAGVVVLDDARVFDLEIVDHHAEQPVDIVAMLCDCSPGDFLKLDWIESMEARRETVEGVEYGDRKRQDG